LFEEGQELNEKEVQIFCGTGSQKTHWKLGIFKIPEILLIQPRVLFLDYIRVLEQPG